MPKFCVGPHVAPGKVYELAKIMMIQILVSIKIRYILKTIH